MQLSSYELAKFSKSFNEQLTKIVEKVDFYAKDELEKKGGSNFSLEFDRNNFTWLTKVTRVLSEKEELSIRDELVNDLKKISEESSAKFTEFDNLLDEIKKKESGSHDDAFFYTPFSSWVNNAVHIIITLYLEFLERSEVKEILKSKTEYEKLVKDAKAKTDSLQNLLNEAKNNVDATSKDINNATERIKTALLEVEKKVSANEVRNINDYYKEYIKNTTAERNKWGLIYGITLTVFLAGIILLFFFYDCIYSEMNLLIPKSLLTLTFIGLSSFFINDFRKRYNITKQIIDELQQKKAIIDTYASLLDNVRNFDEDIKKQYHQKILQNILDTLLLIRNHGYLSKTLNKDNASLASSLVEQIGTIAKSAVETGTK